MLSGQCLSDSMCVGKCECVGLSKPYSFFKSACSVCIACCSSIWAWMCHIPMCWLGRCPSFYNMDTPVFAIPAPFCPMWLRWPAGTAAVPLSISASWMPSWLEFMAAAPAGIIYLSMGFSVRSVRLPAALCLLFVAGFTRLPHQHVLWTWAGNATEQLPNLPANVRLRDWLPQQDLAIGGSSYSLHTAASSANTRLFFMTCCS